jgi:MoaA/NifB/PqqE/SkfB family radical SAM enzyme
MGMRRANLKLRHAVNIAAFAAGGTQPALGPVTAMWDITYLCNYRCLHCNRWENPDPRNDMDTERGMKLVEELAGAGVMHLSLSGGEPFLRKDLFDIVSHAKSLGLGITINTNGTLIDEETARRVAETGVDMIYVSLDGDRPEMHDSIRGKEGSFRQAIDALRLLVKNRKNGVPGIFTNTTLDSSNHRSLPGIAAICSEIGLDGMTFQVAHNLEDMSFTRDRGSTITPDQIDELESDLQILVKKHKKLLPHPEEFFNNFRTFVTEPEKLYKYRCAAAYCIVQIQPDGGVYPCPAAYIKLGDLKKDLFGDIWNSEAARNVRCDIKAGRHPMCWFTCISPLNILLHNAHPFRLHRLAADPNVMYHALRKVWGRSPAKRTR